MSHDVAQRQPPGALLGLARESVGARLPSLNAHSDATYCKLQQSATNAAQDCGERPFTNVDRLSPMSGVKSQALRPTSHELELPDVFFDASMEAVLLHCQ